MFAHPLVHSELARQRQLDLRSDGAQRRRPSPAQARTADLGSVHPRALPAGRFRRRGQPEPGSAASRPGDAEHNV